MTDRFFTLFCDCFNHYVENVVKHDLKELSKKMKTENFVPTQDFFDSAFAKKPSGRLPHSLLSTVCELWDIDITGKIFDAFIWINLSHVKYFFDILLAKKKQVVFEKIKSSKMFEFRDFVSVIQDDKYSNLFVFNKTDIDEIFRLKLKHGILYIINEKISIPNTIIYDVIRTNNENIFMLLIKTNIEFNRDHFKLACKYADISILKEFLERGFMRDRNNSYIAEVLCGTLGSDVKEKKINLLLEYGFAVTKENIIAAVKEKVEIKKSFIAQEFFEDKKFMTELDDACNENNFYVYGIKHNEKGLKNALKQELPINIIKKYLETVKPDVECLEIACEHKNYFAVLKLLIEKHNIQPNMTCMINKARAVKTSQSLGYLIDVIEANNTNKKN